MADTVAIVVSGTTFSQVPKERLIKSSGYFRALLEGEYKDSRNAVYEFTEWSPEAFNVVLQYMVTGRFLLREKSMAVIREALDIPAYLSVDELKSDLTSKLWMEKGIDFALQVAWDLDTSELELSPSGDLRRTVLEYLSPD